MVQFKIGEAAKRAGLTTRCIRYYEELGLMGPREQRLAGKSRTFTERDVARLRKIQMLKRLGLSLEEIAQVIDLYFTDGKVVEGKRKVIEILRAHVASADERIRHLEAFKQDCEANAARLETIVAGLEDEPDGKTGPPSLANG